VTRALALLALAFIVACAPKQPSATELVSSAHARTVRLQSAHFRIDVTKGYIVLGPGLEVLRAEGDVARPDQLRVRVRARLAGIIAESELRQVAGASYYQDPLLQRWRKLDGRLLPVPLLDPDRGVAKLVASFRDPQLAGRDRVGGADCWRVTGRLRTADVAALLGGNAIDSDVPVEACVGDDGLVRRLVVTGTILAGEPSDVVRTIEFSAFDEPVQIDVPS
jgi:lipoprotein LprG